MFSGRGLGALRKPELCQPFRGLVRHLKPFMNRSLLSLLLLGEESTDLDALHS